MRALDSSLPFPSTDEEAVHFLPDEPSERGLFRCRRALGDTIAEAMAETLEVFLFGRTVTGPRACNGEFEVAIAENALRETRASGQHNPWPCNAIDDAQELWEHQAMDALDEAWAQTPGSNEAVFSHPLSLPEGFHYVPIAEEAPDGGLTFLHGTLPLPLFGRVKSGFQAILAGEMTLTVRCDEGAARVPSVLDSPVLSKIASLREETVAGRSGYFHSSAHK